MNRRLRLVGPILILIAVFSAVTPVMAQTVVYSDEWLVVEAKKHKGGYYLWFDVWWPPLNDFKHFNTRWKITKTPSVYEVTEGGYTFRATGWKEQGKSYITVRDPMHLPSSVTFLLPKNLK